MRSYKEKLNAIKVFMFDVDGVLTDGLVYLMNDEIVRALNAKDGYALQYASKMDYKIFIVTGGHSTEVKERLLGLGVTEVHLATHHKLSKYQELQTKYGFKSEEVLYMGDDIPDLPILNLVGVSTCPQDAVTDIKSVVDYQSPIDGGKGCVRDVIEQTLRVQGNWMSDKAFEW
jgi:3-deoxy-D-manno-octulosonate 8-phosphate phosphatase (KDO 8-P phosphatase)